jgi:O-methyltransferase involved in polyketide biosynthesis
MMGSDGSGAVSPTAHYTGETWVRNGLSHPQLATWQGRALHGALALPNAASRALGGPSLEGLLLARHRIIDSLLEDLIEGGVCQVVEAACGMSPRGWRFSERYGERLTYVEADLPAMARRKREALAQMGSLGEHHRVVELDVLRDGGPGSLESLAEELDPAKGLAIVTEGLLTYFDDETVEALWARLARVLGRFSKGAYLADLRFARPDRGLPEHAFRPPPRRLRPRQGPRLPRRRRDRSGRASRRRFRRSPPAPRQRAPVDGRPSARPGRERHRHHRGDRLTTGRCARGACSPASSRVGADLLPALPACAESGVPESSPAWRPRPSR